MTTVIQLHQTTPRCIIVMGVSGSGKSTIGEQLATRLGADFIDGDDLHPRENIAKMTRGEALTDADRAPWLRNIATQAQQKLNQGLSVVIVCSALKKRYRQIFREALSALHFVFLKGSYDTIRQRMETRQRHFMKADMLKGQFATLEEPDFSEQDVITGDIMLPVETLLQTIAEQLATPHVSE